MTNNTINEVIRQMPDHLSIKVRRVARDKKLSLADAVLFLVQKGINASEDPSTK